MLALDDSCAAAKILIIDDEPLNIGMLRLMLSEAGYNQLLTTHKPEEAGQLYHQHYPDLVLLDLNMPGKDGFEVLQELQLIEKRSYLPVMVLTAETDEESRLKALDLGAKDFLTKPFNRVEVLTRIRNLLEVRLLHRKLHQQNNLLEEKVRQRTLDLRESQLEIVRRLGLAAEYRDNETGAHIMRMSQYSTKLAQAYGLPEDDCELLLNASPMHDIGKIGIPDHILLKPGKLTDEEFSIMKTHTTIGAEVLANNQIKLMDMAKSIALTHHEKWDGSGYPNGHKEQKISILGRIVAVCDVFDALTSERPYKKAWSVEDSVKEINKLSGSHFDPQLVPIFNNILPEILEIKARYSDENAAEIRCTG